MIPLNIIIYEHTLVSAYDCELFRLVYDYLRIQDHLNKYQGINNI